MKRGRATGPSLPRARSPLLLPLERLRLFKRASYNILAVINALFVPKNGKPPPPPKKKKVQRVHFDHRRPPLLPLIQPHVVNWPASGRSLDRRGSSGDY